MRVAIIGGGPAGLCAAEVTSAAGIETCLYEAKASVGRKFLVAGKGGLNLTNAEPDHAFVARYSEGPWADLLSECNSAKLREWASGLGVETFAASTGRVYPREMKAAPLLRRWVQRLRGQGVSFAVHHRWTGLRRLELGWELEFQTPEGTITTQADAVILALGGACWPGTGSDGKWTGALERLGVAVAPLQPANCGWETPWPAAFIAEAEGQPLKNVAITAGGREARGELMVTRYGLEGGPLYQLGSVLRALPEPALTIDFKPGQTAESLAAKLAPSSRVSFIEAGRRWNLGVAATALFRHTPGIPALATPAEFARLVKSFPIALTGPRPIAEAISTAGGVKWAELDERLMIRSLPGVFVAGEMIDWEAPTGGYLIQGCFATGTRAARGVAEYFGRGGGAS